MLEVLVATNPGHRAIVYFGHADGAINDRNYLHPALIGRPYTREQLLPLLNLHLLLYDELVIPDNFLLHNIVLREIFADRYDNPQPHARFLADGAISITERDSVGRSFLDLELYLRERGAYGHPGLKFLRGYSQLLDDKVKRRVPYQEEISAANLQSLFEARLAEPIDDRLDPGAAEVSQIVRGALQDLSASDYRRALRGRTWFFHLADRVQARNAAAAAEGIRLWSSAVAQYSSAISLDLDPAYPVPLADNVLSMQQVGRRMRRDLRPVAQEVLQSRLRVGPEDLATLSVDAIAEIRKGRSFRRFVRRTQEAARETDAERFEADLSEALGDYVTDLHDLLALEITGNRSRYAANRRATKLAAASFLAAGLGSSAVGLTVPVSGTASTVLNVASITWSVAGAALPHWLSSRASHTLRTARTHLSTGPAYSRSGLIQLSGHLTEPNPPQVEAHRE